jgi:type II secretory pathway component PulF
MKTIKSRIALLGHAARVYVKNRGRPKLQEKIVFFKLLSRLLEAGFSILQALTLCAQEGRRQPLPVQHFMQSLSEGGLPSEVVGRDRRWGGPVVRAFLKGGEKSHTLGPCCAHIAVYFERKRTLQNILRKSLVYPLLLLSLMLGVMVTLCIVLLPKVLTFQDEAGIPLGWSSQSLLWVYQNADLLLYSLLFFVGSLLLVRVLSVSSAPLKMAWHRFLLTLPYGGKLWRSALWENIFVLSHLLLKAGVKLPETLQIVSESVPCAPFIRVLTSIRGEMVKGVSLEAAFAKVPYLPPFTLAFLSFGEKAGDLAYAFAELARLSHEETLSLQLRLKTVLEPACLLALGGILVWIILGLFLPFYQSVEMVG